MSTNKWVALYPVCYRVMYVLLLAGILIMGFGDFLGIRNVGGWHWFLVAVLIALFAWVHYGRVKEKIIAIVLLLVCVLVLVPFIGAGRAEGFFENYYHWLILREDYIEEWIAGYELLQTVWVVAGCYLFQMIAQKSCVVKELSAVGLLATLIICMFQKVEVHHVGVALVICYVAACVVERIRLGWDKKKVPDKQGYMIWLAPFLAVYILLMSVIPAREEPYDWAIAKRIYHNVREKIVTWMEEIGRNGSEDFEAFMTGFSDESRLGDGLAEDNRALMTVIGGESLMTNLYLTGKVYDTFDGREWKQTLLEDMDEFPLDTLETLYAVRRYDSKWFSNYMRSTRITLKYGSFDTSYLFVPLKPSYLSEPAYEIVGRDFKFEEQRGYGTTYTLGFYQLNLETAVFAELLQTQLPEDEAEWKNTVSRYAPGEYQNLTLEDLQVYRQRIKDSYSREVVLSERVREYLQQITENCETPYEKLRAIEQELAGFVYTDSPGKLPRDVDTPEAFLDYFLLESKQGFCSYFATAFVLLAQAEGFPARYAEGFCVSMEDSTEAMVYSNMSHAWPEVYLEGVGWIPFEPTPGYGSIRYDGWMLQKPMEEKPVEEEYIPFTTPVPTPIPEGTMPEAVGSNIWGYVLVVLEVVVIVLPLLFVVLLLERWRQKRRYLKMSTEDKFLVEVKRNLRLFAGLGCKRGETETLSELQERIRENLPELMQKRKEWQFIMGYEEFLYRKAEVSDIVLQESIRERAMVLQWLKENNKGYYYMICVWLFLTM